MKNIVFITLSSETHRTSEESIGIGYLTSILRNCNYSVTILDGWLHNLSPTEIIEHIKKIEDILFIGFSCYALSFEILEDLIKKIKKLYPKTPIIAGGYGPTFHSQKFLNIGFDYVLRGEGEDTIPKIAENLLNGLSIKSINGLSFIDRNRTINNPRVNTISNLDSIPFPSRDTLKQTMKLKNPAHLVTSRGCYGNCKFCSINSFYSKINIGNKWRQRGIENIVEEIKFLFHDYGVTCFKFLDDSFIEPPRNEIWADKFANLLLQNNLKIKFRTQMRANRVTDELTSILSGCGWFATSLGIENFSNSALKRMSKGVTKEENLKSLEILEKNNIYTQMGLILFDDRTTIKELKENYQILKQLKWPVIKGIFTEMYAAQGTTFTDAIKNNDLIINDHNGNLTYKKKAKIMPIYEALKKWQKSHCKIYDHAMNPISAPKYLPVEGYIKYHAICMEIYEKDIDFFERIINLEDCDQKTITNLSSEMIEKNSSFYELIEKKLNHLDRNYLIDFNAQINPFL